MPHAAVKGTSYCLNFTPELGIHYGNTPYMERLQHPDSDFLAQLKHPQNRQTYEDAARYMPNRTYIGAATTDELSACPQPWSEHLAREATRFGRFGEIMPEDEFLGLMDLCDVFDLIWLEEHFAKRVAQKLAAHPLLREEQLARLESGHTTAEIEAETAAARALPLYHEGQVVGCCRRGHDHDENLAAYTLLENLASKAGGVLALLHLIKNAGISPGDVDFVVECSEEAAGDMNQRGGGNIAKAIAEIAGCANASGCDVRSFCAGPANGVVTASALVASGARRCVAVVAGGAVPKLFMNARDHLRKGVRALENCLGNFAALIVPEDGVLPIIRLDALGTHTVGAGASPQAVTTALVHEPLERAGLRFADVDKYAPELHIPEITLPAGAGNVPEANYKMIAALAVMKKQMEKSDIPAFIEKHGLPGFAHTQGHIPSGVPFLGHAACAIAEGKMTRAMIIGKGSLFLGRLTNLADGLSFLVEKPSMPEAAKVETTACGTRKTFEKTRIGLVAVGSEVELAPGDRGQANILAGALAALERDPRIEPVLIGPRLGDTHGLAWIETPDCEADIANVLAEKLRDGSLAGAVAMHHPFPIGVATIGKVSTPARGKEMLIASTTGTAAAGRIEAMLRNALYGIATAKALGIARPLVGVLNVDGAATVLGALKKLRDRGYEIAFATSVRNDGGAILRGNDLLEGAADVCVTDTLTGNVLMKLFSSWSSGGGYEAAGWGYGPSVGEAWAHTISIVSRVSGSPVIAQALSHTARCVRGGLATRIAEELKRARDCGFDKILEELRVQTQSKNEKMDATPPPQEPTDAEIHGVDVLDVEGATQHLWSQGIYAEASMGCTGPVVKVASANADRATRILSEAGYLS